MKKVPELKWEKFVNSSGVSALRSIGNEWNCFEIFKYKTSRFYVLDIRNKNVKFKNVRMPNGYARVVSKIYCTNTTFHFLKLRDAKQCAEIINKG